MRLTSRLLGTLLLASSFAQAATPTLNAEAKAQMVQLLTCVRGTFEISTVSNTKAQDVRAMINILDEAISTENSDLTKLLNDCQTIYSAHIDSKTGIRTSVSAFFASLEGGAEQKKKAELWDQEIQNAISASAKFTLGTGILQKIIEPKETCEVRNYGGFSLYVGGASLDSLTCVDTAGHSYFKIKSTAGAAVQGGCAAIVLFNKSLNLWYQAGPDDWSKVIDLH